jgi:hypothetical protein
MITIEKIKKNVRNISVVLFSLLSLNALSGLHAERAVRDIVEGKTTEELIEISKQCSDFLQSNSEGGVNVLGLHIKVHVVDKEYVLPTSASMKNCSFVKKMVDEETKRRLLE